MTRRRLPVLAGAIAFLTAVTGGAAYAVATAPLDLDVTAAAAGIGVTVGSAHASTGLAEGYDEGDGRFANAGAVTITNTGTRAAEVRLALDPSSATSNLPAAITVSIGAVAAEAECTPSATLADAQSGTLGTGSAATPFEYRSSAVPAELGPEETIVLCVQTAIDPSSIDSFGATSLQIQVTAALRYATGSAWTATGTPFTVTQHIATEDIANLFNGAGRFTLYGAYDAAPYGSAEPNVTTTGAYCVAWGASPLRFGFTTNTGCGGWNDQVRLVQSASSSNEFMLLQNMNGWDQPSTPRWEYAGPGADVVLAAPQAEAPEQRWVIEGRGDGTYRIVTAPTYGTPGALCLQHTTLDINPHSGPGGLMAPGGYKQIRAVACIPGTASTHDTAEYRRQGFRFSLIGTPLPPKTTHPNGYPATCAPNVDHSFATVSWPTSTGYEGETRFRMVWTWHDPAGQAAPFTMAVAAHHNGWWTSIQLRNTTAGVEDFWTGLQAHLAANSLPPSSSAVAVEMVVEQQITNNDIYRPITVPQTMGLVHLGALDNRIHCGAPPAPPAPPPAPSPSPTPDPSPTPSDPIAFPASWCAQPQGNYLSLRWPHTAGSTWRVFLWKDGDPPIDPAGSLGLMSVLSSWHHDGHQHMEIQKTGPGSWTEWLSDHGGGTHPGVEVRLYRDLGAGNWEYYAVREMTFSSTWPDITCG